MFESDASKELLRIARVINDETDTIHLSRQLLDLAHHHFADPLPPQLAGDDDVVHAHGIADYLQLDHGDDFAEELADESAGRDGAREEVTLQERAHIAVIAGFDRPDEET